MACAVLAFALARFAFWTQAVLFAARFRFVRRIEDCDARCIKLPIESPSSGHVIEKPNQGS
jgi:hypothetical protein